MSSYEFTDSQNHVPESILPPLPIEQETGGFLRGGDNETSIILGLTELNSIPVRELSRDMQPGGSSRAGFLGQNEKLIDVLAHDNDTVHAHGLTHQNLADPLRYIEGLNEQRKLPGNVTIADTTYGVRVDQWRGYQYSPFQDGTKASADMHVTNLESGHAFSASMLMGEMIGRYGFYEGKKTSYRLAPETIIETFSHLRSTEQAAALERDPIVMITSGQATSGNLTNLDQVDRYMNLDRIGAANIRSAEVAVRLKSSADVLAFLNDATNEALIAHLDPACLDGLEPATLKLTGSAGITDFAKSLNVFDSVLQQKVMNLVSRVDASATASFFKKQVLEQALTASIKQKEDGYEVLPVAALVEKVRFTPEDFLDAFYRAAGGRYNEWGVQKAGEVRGSHYSDVELNEGKARALASVFGERVKPFVEEYREAMGIDESQPFDDQVVAFLKRRHVIEKAQKLASGYFIKQIRPDLTVPDMITLYGVVESVKAAGGVDDLDDTQSAFLTRRGISVESIAIAHAVWPGARPENIVEDTLRPRP